jgi:hypothetical protein
MQELGAQGGKARSARMTKAQRSESAKKAALARWKHDSKTVSAPKGDDSSTLERLVVLQNEISDRRKKNNSAREARTWNSESVAKLELVQLLDFVQDQLDLIMRSPSHREGARPFLGDQMSSNNIIEFNRSAEAAKRVRQKLDVWRAANDEWVSATLDLAVELWSARQMHVTDQAFGIWLAENELDETSKDDRAALIGMGQHLETARAVLEDTDRRSLRLIWRDLILPKLVSQSCETAAAPVSAEECPKTDATAQESSEAVSEDGHAECRDRQDHPA